MRLTPQELTSCAAIVKAAGVELPGGTSLSGMARAAVNVLINSAIQCKLIPEPSGWEGVSEYMQYKRSYTPAQKGKTAYGFQMDQLRRMQAGMTPVNFGAALEPLVITDEDRRRNAEAVKRALMSGVVDDEPGATSPRPTTNARNARIRKRIDPRKLRFDELKFKSENNAENMEPREFKEMRRLARELGVQVAA